MTAMRTRTRIGLATMAAISVGTVSLLVTPAGETVASFVDLEHANGVFTSGKWNVQGNSTADVSASSSGWTDHFTSANLAVFQPALGTVIPGSTRSYSRFGLRMAPGSSAGATVTIPAGVESPPGKADKFQMRIVKTTSEVCNAGSFVSSATFVMGRATPTFGHMKSSPDPGANTLSLPKNGTPVFLCYEFSLPLPIPSGLNNGDAATVSWTYRAVSS